MDKPYIPENKIRIITAASLFDGHDVSINIMRRILQASGTEVVHLGHNRSAGEIVETAIQEDAHAIAITSYQGGHNEFFKYMSELLRKKDAGHIKIFGGGGGTIFPEEIKKLEKNWVERIYAPDDGRKMGLQGMIDDLLKRVDYPIASQYGTPKRDFKTDDYKSIARWISFAENDNRKFKRLIKDINPENLKQIPVIGITGTGGAGKSSVVDELVRRFLDRNKNRKIAIVSVDPSKRKTGGALLGDRIRMNAIYHPSVYMRSMATRQANVALSGNIQDIITILKNAEFDLILVETSGIGQSGSEIIDHSDVSLYIMTPEYGAATQLEKIDMLDFADVIALNKFDKTGAVDALRDIRKQYRRNHLKWDLADEDIPVIGTIASQFNDEGMNNLYNRIMSVLKEKSGFPVKFEKANADLESKKHYIIPPDRTRYLSEISDEIKKYNHWVEDQRQIARKLYSVENTLQILDQHQEQKNDIKPTLTQIRQDLTKEIADDNLKKLKNWEKLKKRYRQKEFSYLVRGKEIKSNNFFETLAHLQVPKVHFPGYEAWGDVLRWILQENVPGEFPFTSGVYPFRRKEEEPTRMFAGEGTPERTNRRFHYLSREQPAKRLSTAFDSVTLYGEDPDTRPDIYGKIGNSGVSIATLDDAKKLYSGFHLINPATSVSMTINGPASMLTAFFMNTAIDQECEKYILKNGMETEVKKKIRKKFESTGSTPPEYSGTVPDGHDGLGLLLLGISGNEVLPAEQYENIKKETISRVRGTVQADILKEDQAQNTCIFSTEFSLRMMGDVQEYFVKNRVRNFYSVSISGYHIAEAGANPITQLAFTLANGFTYLEYYASRGMNVDDFAPNFSFFFSNGIDAEYAVIGRVARRIWSKALKLKYGANERSQKLKYHIQTSGRSLHAQEIDFNDIRTTLQALYAIYDNCNSLHTNAFDEAITTPTEQSVRRAMAIQLIINRELGLAKSENPMQGSFIIEELTDLVEEAVLMEFDRLTERGGVLGAMETMYQRGKIQDESLYYETLKHSGKYPVIGVNTFLSSEGSPTVIPGDVTRATTEEKKQQIQNLKQVQKINHEKAGFYLDKLKKAAIRQENTFAILMDAVKYCTLGQITHCLFEVGGQYRRNM